MAKHPGYDPRDMANMFKTIEKQGGSGGPQWLSDHPNPGDRQAYITKEAQTLRVENPIRDTRGFQQVRAHLSRMAPAPTTEQATKNARNGAIVRPGRPDAATRACRPAASSRRREASAPTLSATRSRISVPSNWQELRDGNSVTYAPQSAFGTANGQSVFTHGVEIGISRNESHDLQTATDELLASLAQGGRRGMMQPRACGGTERPPRAAVECVRGHRPA